MATKKKMLQAAAGNAGSAEVLPEAVSFDGTNDYLSRSSDMTGNADGKTVTFSGWIYRSADVTGSIYSSGGLFRVFFTSDNFAFKGYNSATSVILNAYANFVSPRNTWQHFLVSVDLANASNRYVFVDDVDVTSSVTWSTYTNDILDFTQTQHAIGATAGGSDKLESRLSNVFLDYTYRNLSIEANRRLFIDAEGKPASGQADLSPILYLPLSSADTAGSNSGTGGDFTVNGVLATAERGPNQDNCSASTFDGVGDYLSRSSVTGMTDGKVFTFSVNFLDGATANNEPFFAIAEGGNQKFYIRTANAGGGNSYLTFAGQAVGSTTTVLAHTAYVASEALRDGRFYSIQISVDLTDTNKRIVIINGITLADNWATYTNTDIDFTGSEGTTVGATAFNNYYRSGSIGELYFDTIYTDLATDNPFWDSDANRPNSVRKVIEDTGVTPLIALPIVGSDAGNNLGTGGDFTVNSGPYAGARGGSEYWARSAYLADAANYFSKSTTMSDSTTVALSMSFRMVDANGLSGLLWFLTGKALAVQVSSNQIIVENYTDKVRIFGNTTISNNTWYNLLVSINTTTQTGNLYINGVADTATWSIATNAMPFSNTTSTHIGYRDSNNSTYGDIANVYFTTDYIDFSQESNRLKFVDVFGYSVDLQPDIDAGDIPTPLIYMKFEDTTALGTNSGSGGDFTVNGTVISGSDVKG